MSRMWYSRYSRWREGGSWYDAPWSSRLYSGHVANPAGKGDILSVRLARRSA